MDEITSKTIDGITDLVVIAPIKDGFIQAYENVTYATRLKLVAEALNRIRVSAREYERIVPFSDVTERILNLLDFRVGVLDKDLFGMVDTTATRGRGADRLESRRYLYLTATFEGGWEPYMRLIWQPLGPFLDLLFCNCDGYVTATEHSCEEYLQWVRDNQMDSAIFYNTTGLTTRDQKYLSRIERLQRGGASDLELAGERMAYPEPAAGATRTGQGELARAQLAQLGQPSPDQLRAIMGAPMGKTLELGLEALNVIYKLADYYPPEWLTGRAEGITRDGRKRVNEGHRLLRAAREILLGWEGFIAMVGSLPADNLLRMAWDRAQDNYAEPLAWYRSGVANLKRIDALRLAQRRPDPALELDQVQGGIVKAQGSADQPVLHGALALFTIRDAAMARQFVAALQVHYAAGTGADAPDGIYRTVGFTAEGLLRMGLPRDVLDRFPKEFREGMEKRSGIIGDMHENHPRNWSLPERNGPALTMPELAGIKLPPVELAEVDLVVQLRSTNADPAKVLDELRALAVAAQGAATLEAYELLQGGQAKGEPYFRDHFGFADGISQPAPKLAGTGGGLPRDAVNTGEVLLGFANDRGDAAPGDYTVLDDWRRRSRRVAQRMQRHGSYLVLRKIGEEVERFEAWLTAGGAKVAQELGIKPDDGKALLKAKLMGRDADGQPLIPAGPGGNNDFDYGQDPRGAACPFAAHVRRANPRRTVLADPHGPISDADTLTRAEFNRPTPRLVRRAMLFGSAAPAAPRGLMFMAYNASIAEQYEVIQRWLNGGNSTDLAAAAGDPLTGILPRENQGTFRFIARNAAGQEQVVRVPLPLATPAPTPTGLAEPGKHPFTPLYWGLYLFMPSRSALAELTGLTNRYLPMRNPSEYFVGQSIIDRIESLSPAEAAKEWKRLLEDFAAKDPGERDLTPNMWAAIRYYYGGAHNLRRAADQGGPIAVPGAAADLRRTVPGTIKAHFPVAQNLAEYTVQELDPASDTQPFDQSQLGMGRPNTPLECAADGDAPDDAAKCPYNWQDPDRTSQNVVLVAGRSQVRKVLHDWESFSSEEQLRRIAPNSGPIFVTQQPDNKYHNPSLNHRHLDYPGEAIATNAILLRYGEQDGFLDGYRAGQTVLRDLVRRAGPRPSFKVELRRQYLLPALGQLCHGWYGLPDGVHMADAGWSWSPVDLMDGSPPSDLPLRPMANCPGDFLSPSRNAFYPRPSEEVADYADNHGKAILRAARKFVAAHRAEGGPPVGDVAKAMFAAIPDDEVLARNLVGTMVGAIPPMDGNLRGILLEWLGQKSLWRHQAALRAACGGKLADSNAAAAIAVLAGPISQAMCMRPAPDLLYRTAQADCTIDVSEPDIHTPRRRPVEVKEGDLVVVSQVAASQRSLFDPAYPDGDVSIVFGGRRDQADQIRTDDPAYPVHACPAKDMAFGAIMGIMAALLDVGTIQALPASLIVRISDWPRA